MDGPGPVLVFVLALLTGGGIVACCTWLTFWDQPESIVIPLRRWLLGKPYAAWLRIIDKFGKRRQWDSWVLRLLEGDHPIVQILYLTMMILGYILFIFGAFPLLEANPRVSAFHRWISLAIVSLCLLHYAVLCRSEPGHILDEKTALPLCDMFPKESHRKGSVCSTCHFLRPGMSKHCPACDGCVAKLDHHCVWIRNCVGLLNWRYFMTFVALHAAMCTYGAIIIWRVLNGELIRRDVWRARFFDGHSYQDVSKSLIIEFIVGRYPTLVTLWAACVAFGSTLFLFLGFHTWLHFGKKTTTYGFSKKGFRAPGVLSSTPLWEIVFQDCLPLQWIDWKIAMLNAGEGNTREGPDPMLPTTTTSTTSGATSRTRRLRPRGRSRSRRRSSPEESSREGIEVLLVSGEEGENLKVANAPAERKRSGRRKASTAGLEDTHLEKDPKQEKRRGRLR